MAEKRLKTCGRGPRFYKSSDCNSCPICAAEEKPQDGFLSLLSAPARRALTAAQVSTMAELARRSERDILALHGVGPKSLPVLRQALSEAGLAFAEPLTVPLAQAPTPGNRPEVQNRRPVRKN